MIKHDQFRVKHLEKLFHKQTNKKNSTKTNFFNL